MASPRPTAHHQEGGRTPPVEQPRRRGCPHGQKLTTTVTMDTPSCNAATPQGDGSPGRLLMQGQ